MIPWPIALLSLSYVFIAAMAAKRAWLITTGLAGGSLLIQAVWLGLAGGAAIGLALLRPWGRRLAIWTSLSLMALFAGLATLAVAAREPAIGLATACLAGLQMVPIRYLRRLPATAWWSQGAES
jgi:hypothetical protein